MARSNVLFLFTRAQLGGTEIAISRVATHIDSSRFKVGLASLEARGPLHHFLAGQKLQLYQLPGSDFVYRSFLHSSDQVRRLIESANIGVIYAFGLTAELVTLAARRTDRFPAIVSGQRGGYASRSLRGLLRGRVANACDLIVFNSQTAWQGATEHNHFSVSKSRVIYNGIQPLELLTNNAESTAQVNSLFAAHGLNDREEQLVVTIANIHAPKDYHSLLKAARLVLDHFPKARFLAIGRDGMDGTIHQLAATLGISNEFQFLGSQSNSIALEILNRSAVYVLSSLSEGMPNSILEAMMLRRPVVASAVGGVPELVEDGISGLLFAPRDDRSCASHIESLLSDRVLAENLGRAGHQRAQTMFSIERSAQATEQMFDELLDNNWR